LLLQQLKEEKENAKREKEKEKFQEDIKKMIQDGLQQEVRQNLSCNPPERKKEKKMGPTPEEIMMKGFGELQKSMIGISELFKEKMEKKEKKEPRRGKKRPPSSSDSEDDAKDGEVRNDDYYEDKNLKFILMNLVPDDTQPDEAKALLEDKGSIWMKTFLTKRTKQFEDLMGTNKRGGLTKEGLVQFAAKDAAHLQLKGKKKQECVRIIVSHYVEETLKTL
jgi:hypothetical protein